MYIPTITLSDLKHCDLLFYRPQSMFGRLIGLYTAWKHGKFDRLAFSHVAIVIKGQRFDAMEGYRTGFRDATGSSYVYSIKNLTDEHRSKIEAYCLSRQGSKYDRRGILSFIFPRMAQEDEFSDYCSEMVKNALVFAEIIEDTERITPYDLNRLIREKVVFKGIIL